MEEAKIYELDIARNRPLYSWFWQSDLDPWKETDEAKWKWTAYPDDISSLIEEAALSKQPILNIKNYEIDLTKMLQINKKDRNKIRRIKKEVRFELESRFLTEIESPKPIQQDEKTINHAFGNIRHFLNYIMKRTPTSYNIFQQLENLSLDSKFSEYKNISEEVICSIEKAAEEREKVIQSRIQNPSKNCIIEAKRIVGEIRSVNSKSLRDFLLVILRLYTMETYLCYYLNELLRNEKWEELNVLTPYLVCLAYAFQIQDYVIKLPHSILIKIFKRRRLALYRGATLTEDHLEFYVQMKEKHFSWNGVTSTSRSRNIAIRFLKLSLKKAKKNNEKKVGIIFRIETDFETPEDCEGMIDVSGYSKYPKEQEVILAPGTVFELASIKEDKKENIYQIKLRVKKKFNESKEQIPLLGALQSQVIQKDNGILDNLPREEFIKALELLDGNKLLSKLDIKNCVIDDYLIRLIKETRVNSLQHLSLNFRKCILISDNGLNHLKDALKMLTSLQHLSLDFRYCDQISDIGLNHLKDALKMLTSLQHLSLDFSRCEKISDNGLNHLKDALKMLTSLQHLSLDFFDCNQISDNGLNHIKDALKMLTSLQHLSLDFFDCSQISDNGLNHLKDALKMLTSLQHLSLNFWNCNQISDNGLNHLKDALKMLTSLQHLSLDFRYCDQISDIGLNHLKDALKMLTSLQHLSLDFFDCDQISDNGLNHLKDALKMLTSLQHLSLYFRECDQISDNGLNHLKDALKMLTSLQNLHINN